MTAQPSWKYQVYIGTMGSLHFHTVLAQCKNLFGSEYDNNRWDWFYISRSTDQGWVKDSVRFYFNHLEDYVMFKLSYNGCSS